MTTIIGITGSMRWPSRTHTLVEIALGGARETGARVELIDLRLQALPLYAPQAGDNPAAQELRDHLRDAQGLIIGTPEYHGAMSGTLKNCLDYLVTECSGKVIGSVVATGAHVGAATHLQLREVAAFLHAWTVPYDVTAAREDFDESGRLVNERVRDRLLRLGRDVAVYGELLHTRFVRDAVASGGPHLGFAPWFSE